MKQNATDMIENILKRLEELPNKERLELLEYEADDLITIHFEDLAKFDLNFVIEIEHEYEQEYDHYEGESFDDKDSDRTVEVVTGVHLYFEMDEVLKVLDVTAEQKEKLKDLIIDFKF